MLTRTDFLDGNKRLSLVCKVPMPEWGDHVYVRRIPADELPAVNRIVEKAQSGKEDDVSLAAWWCVMGICDAKGKRLFKDSDHAKMMKRPLVAVTRCAMAFGDFNHLTDDADGKRKKN